MKYCSQCGSQISDDARFCEKCGSRVQSGRQTADYEPEPPKKKTLGQKMMDNFRTNMELQRERRRNFKWWYWVIIAIALAYFLKL